MTPFTIHIPDPFIADLKLRLAQTRFPDDLDGAAWDYGTPTDYLRALCAYWQNDFDWRAREAALNAFPQFTTRVNGLDVHFIHQRSPVAHALPLIVTHGWPGSVAEFEKILGPLTDPEAHGGSPEDAFHVVCPSMPGYGFSAKPTKPGFDIKAVGDTNAALMTALGYGRYGAQGGDWGALASTWNALAAPDRVCGIHLNMLIGKRPEENPYAGVSDGEKAGLERSRRFQAIETGYQRIQGTKPQALGPGLNDSPAGLAAWIVEKFRTWSDCGGDLESKFTKDELLTNIAIYWFTETITSSTRLYYESMKSKRFGPAARFVETPTAFAAFPHDLSHLPRAWAETCYNVTRWTAMPRGGHFAAMEEPALLVEDIRAFFRPLR